MNCDRIIATLRGHEPELRAAGEARLSVFGSMARGESRPDSDIDLLAGFDASRRLSLLDAGLLGQPADLVEEGTLKLRGATRKECPPR